MSRGKQPKISAAVDRLRRQIERWRQTRRKRSPMPEELWQEAARLAEDHRISPIAPHHGVGYASLKGRVEQAPPPDEDAPSHGGEFVELSAEQLFGASPRAVVVELAAQDGLRLTVRLDDGGQLDVVRLLEAFCERGRP
jgi:hypothetical protein